MRISAQAGICRRPHGSSGEWRRPALEAAAPRLPGRVAKPGAAAPSLSPPSGSVAVIGAAARAARGQGGAHARARRVLPQRAVGQGTRLPVCGLPLGGWAAGECMGCRGVVHPPLPGSSHSTPGQRRGRLPSRVRRRHTRTVPLLCLPATQGRCRGTGAYARVHRGSPYTRPGCTGARRSNAAAGLSLGGSRGRSSGPLRRVAPSGVMRKQW